VIYVFIPVGWVIFLVGLADFTMGIMRTNPKGVIMLLLFTLIVALGSYAAHALVAGRRPCTCSKTEPEPILEIRTKEDELEDLYLDLIRFMVAYNDKPTMPREDYGRQVQEKKNYIKIVKVL
jgi:hypothetical protein